MQSPSTDTPKSPEWLLWVGFILVALNMRLIFATVGPVLKNLQLGTTATLLVTTLPLLLLGLCSTAGIHLRQRMGEERALCVALALLIVGCGIRWFGQAGLIVGTILGGAGIAVMNVIMPVLAKKRFGFQRMGMVMGVYALMMGVGAVLGASASFPLFKALGADTPAAFHSLGLWTLPALLALLFWLPQWQHKPQANTSQHHASSAPAVNVYKNRTAWALTLFFGLQALNLYVFLPWLPTMLMDRGTTQANAAWLFSLSQVSLMVSSFLIPWLAARSTEHRGYLVLTILTCLLGTLGLHYAPLNSAIVWVLLLGFGQGAAPSLGAYLFVAKSASMETATRISAMAQTVGYLIAVTGPLLIGAIYQRTGDWSIPIWLLSAILVVELLVCLPAGRNVKV